ncbi:5-(carboxyamino)imidazole ribonucleotide synthase [Mesohalobacter halotolerans]|uniref:N5-carboxyaminoimidazole ribonucleotide synthase n=1 Tax=Mesohalobacter halotolerans TaxID=1883405 RepID=A0A4V6ALB9_9FLAO|nr:5-(carboxyamino)imidazole ribonucleotide synthase [Mesohalobacter halotolerans]TKS56065.1 5-(carboxyamino)imidazole ribonucleotide synthase [Mesohalobacter halotolerans]
MPNYFSSDFKLGILGGGQLGKMLLYETRKFDIQTKVLDPNPEAPCKIACNEFVRGDLMNYDTVINFAEDVDVLTIEIENVNVDALETLENLGKKVFPSAKTLKRIRDKGIQKQFYKDSGIPTSPFKLYDNKSELLKDFTQGEIQLPIVWKSRTGGYDGRGVSILKTEADIDSLPDTPCLLEQKINFKNELAVIVARSVSGETKTYPVVEMEFHPTANQVEYVICPARIDDHVSKQAQEVARKVSNAFEQVGLLAVELFQTQDDEILVNEVAPRPHNSGHYSIEGAFTNQFEQHLRAVLDLPLGSTESKVGAVMVNLVGDENHEGNVYYENIEKILELKGVIPHIYGKAQTRPFRKMGHVTIVDKNLNTARQTAEEVKGLIKVISK